MCVVYEEWYHLLIVSIRLRSKIVLMLKLLMWDSRGLPLLMQCDSVLSNLTVVN